MNTRQPVVASRKPNRSCSEPRAGAKGGREASDPTPHTVRLDVPTGVHPVFHVELVRPAASDPFPSQIVDDTQPAPIEVDGELEYEVEEILDWREKRAGRNTQIEVLVRWAGYAETTWERLDVVENCSALDRYEKRFGPVPGPSRHRIDDDGDIVIPAVRLHRC
jgi:hypothetical protein